MINAIVKQRRIVAFLFCLCFSLSSLYALRLELSPFGLPRVTDTAFFAEFAQNAGHQGLSTYSRQLLMTECYKGTQRVWREGKFDGAARDFLESCDAAATRAVEAVPTFSYGWLTKAYVAMSRLDDKGFNASLAMAHRTAPDSLWLIEGRVRLAELYNLLLDPVNRAYHDEDLKQLAQSGNGSRLLAELYQKDEHFRQKVVALVETLPPDVQKRFLQNVRRLANSR